MFRYYEFLDGNCNGRFEKGNKKVDVLTINDEEARLLSTEYSLKSCTDNSWNGSKILIIKKENTLLFDKENTFLPLHFL